MSEGEIDFRYRRVGRQGMVLVTIATPDGQTFTDKADISKETARSKLLERIAERLGPDVAGLLDVTVEEAANQVVEDNSKDVDEKSQADELVDLAADAYLFHTPGGYDSEGYAAVEVGDHRETWSVGSNAFKRWLAKRFHNETGKAPNSSAIDDALTIIAGKAIYEGPEHEVAIRMAGAGDAVYLDLGDSEWCVVEITNAGWRVISGKDAPVWFIRKRGMLALPVPVKGGTIDELRPLLNLLDDTSWVLFVGCLVGYLRPTGPYPILIVDGEQGSAKSTTCRFAVRLIDPRKAALRRPPKSERDLMIAASNGWLVGFDNLSGVQPWLSDTICSLATGGGFAARELYTDDDEKLFDAMRPVLLNGIDSVATRSDLLDRAVHLHLPNIPDEKRLQQRELEASFETVHPRVLGALLDAVSAALKGHASVQLDRTPRMADLATWVTAAEPALAWRRGTFLDAYLANREEANEAAIEASAVGQAVLGFMRERLSWEGTAQELLDQLDPEAAGKVTLAGRRLPKSAAGLSRALRRVAPNLRASGLVVEFLPREGRRRPIRLARGARQSGDDGSGPARDGQASENRHSESGPRDPANGVDDARDGDDGSAGAGEGEACEWSA